MKQIFSEICMIQVVFWSLMVVAVYVITHLPNIFFKPLQVVTTAAINENGLKS